MPNHRTFRIILPSDWLEIPGRLPREYKRQVDGAGVLQISLKPPQSDLNNNPEAVLNWLQNFIKQSMPELIESLQEGVMESSAGPCAFSIQRSEQFGLMGLWVIASDAFVFASYIMGSPNTFKDELMDVMTIIESAYFEDGDGKLLK